MPMNYPKISFLNRAVNAVSPAHCAICDCRMTVGEEFLCGKCNIRMPRTGFCDAPLDNEMAKMLWGRFPIEKCAALFFYSPHSDLARLIMDIKYFHHQDYARELGKMMAREIKPSGFFEGIDAIMPVPLARNRERKRGYNQSREIARGIGSVTGLPIVDKAVKREKFVESQTQKSRLERNDNVEHAFSLVDDQLLHDRHLLIVDDILTTGATVTACAREVLKAKNVKISVLTAGFSKS